MSCEKARFLRHRGSLHIHSSFSGTAMTPRDIAGLALKKGLRILVFTDYSDRQWRYRFGVRLTKTSVLSRGIRDYLSTLESLRREFPELVIVSGIEASPFYFWEGTPFNLKCREYNRHILLLGLNSEKDFEGLALMATGRSGFHPFGGDQGSAPYQALIDSARNRGLLTFWAHPEQEDDTRFFTARLFTPARPELLLTTSGYSGFSAYPRGGRVVPAPGGIWDRVLRDYCVGKRERPVWAIGESDYRKETDSIDNPTTVFVDAVSCPEDCLSALDRGRVYALDVPEKNLFLNRFEIADEKAGSIASMGEMLSASGRIHISVEMESGSGIREALLVKNGEVFFSTSKACFELVDSMTGSQMAFFRVISKAKDGGKLLSNPIFLKQKSTPSP